MEGTPSSAAIETRGLTKQYGAIEALTDVTLEVRRGEIFGFLGPNGAGKSTMIRTLLGFLHPTGGEASVLGMDIRDASVEIRRLTGYLPGGVALYDSLSGEQVLDYLVRLQGRPARRRAELCDRLALRGPDLRRRVRDYSRGMRQKLGIIQALQHDPELAILDEPSEGLDPLVQHAFYSILADLRSEGRTIFFSSHVLPEVERICDRVAIIRHGRLMAVHDVRDLLARRRRKVTVQWRGAAPDPTGIPGLADVTVDGDRLFGTLEGDVFEFVRAIASPSLQDLTVEPATLEEAFLEYYAEENALPSASPGAAHRQERSAATEDRPPDGDEETR